MDLGRIKALKAADEQDKDGLIYMSDVAEVMAAFQELIDSGAVLIDEPENALLGDMLNELEDHATTVEKTIYKWVLKNFGENEANDPSWSTAALAKEINQISVIGNSGKLGHLLGEE